MYGLTEELRRFAKEIGVDLVGIAPTERFNELPGLKPEQLLPKAKSVLVLAARRNRYVLTHSRSWNMLEYMHMEWSYATWLSYKVGCYLEDAGYEAFPLSYHGVLSQYVVPPDAWFKLKVDKTGIHNVNEFLAEVREHRKYFPIVHASVEAGLGEIGMNSMLVTPDFGPRVRLAVVITDAELQPNERFKEEVCLREKCNLCVEACPTGAISSYGFVDELKCLSEFHGAFFEVLKRQNEVELAIARAMRAVVALSGPGICIKCMGVCPIGRKVSQRI